MPGRHSRCVDTIANASDDSTNDEMRQLKRRALQSRTDYHNDRTRKDCLSTAEDIANPNAEEGTKETSQVIRCRSNTW